VSSTSGPTCGTGNPGKILLGGKTGLGQADVCGCVQDTDTEGGVSRDPPVGLLLVVTGMFSHFPSLLLSLVTGVFQEMVGWVLVAMLGGMILKSGSCNPRFLEIEVSSCVLIFHWVVFDLAWVAGSCHTAPEVGTAVSTLSTGWLGLVRPDIFTVPGDKARGG